MPVLGAAPAVGGRAPALVALEVVLDPVRTEIRLTGTERSPPVDAVVAELPAGQRAQRQPHHHHHRGRNQRHRTAGRNRPRRPSHEPRRCRLPYFYGPRSSDFGLSGSRFSGSRFSGSRLSGSRLSGSRFSGSHFSGSRFSGSRFSGSRFSGFVGPHRQPPVHGRSSHPDRLAHAQSRRQVHGEVVEGQDPDIPEASLGQDHEAGGDDRSRQRQRHAEPCPPEEQQPRSHQRQDDEQLQRRIVRQEAVVELAAGPQRGQVAALLSPAHVVEQAPVPPERQHPPGAESRGERSGGDGPGEPAAPLVGAPRQDEQQRSHRGQREEGGEQVHQPGEGQQSAGQDPVTPRGHAPRCHAYEQDRAGQAQRVGELARHGRHEVAAVDVERAVEQEQQRGHRSQHLTLGGDPAQTRHRPHRHRQRHHAGDRHQLQSDAVGHGYREQREGGRGNGRSRPPAGSSPQAVPRPPGCRGGQQQPGQGAVGHRVVDEQLGRPGYPGHTQRDGPALAEGPARPTGRRHHDRAGRKGHCEVGEDGGMKVEAHVDHHDEQRRDHHVERECGKAGVPVVGPPGQPQLADEDIPQVGGCPDVGSEVAPGGRGVGEPEPGPQVDDHEPDDRDEHRQEHRHVGDEPPAATAQHGQVA
ncbi:MAG: pentapeptide repeat-containing protein [Acidimicrobiia bacterium]|nr:pentapeptide repeat-containing protein [Acidimicrobiia bacterium]